MTSFTGIWVPLVTPFCDDEVDVASLRALVRHLVDAGVSGLVVCGSTGEAAALSEKEQLAVLDTVLDAATCPVVMGLSSNNMRTALDRLRDIQRRPIAGLLVPPPSYIKPSQAGVADYFITLADTATVPLIVYNIPYRTGVAIALDTFRTIAAHERVTAIKDCGGDPMLTMNLIADGKLQVLAGEDHQILSTLCLGGNGAILAAAHIRPDLFVKLAQQVRAGELEQARTTFYHLLPMIRLLFTEPNPGPLKAALAMTGILRDTLRAPMQSASMALKEQLKAELKRLECV